MNKYRATYLMAAVAAIFLTLHFFTGWEAAVNDAEMHGTSVTMSSYIVEWSRDTFENLQSEFWQLAVQFALIAVAFEFIKIRAYEEDVEEVKVQLKRMESTLEQLKSH